MNRCKTCKYFEPQSHFPVGGECKSGKFIYRSDASDYPADSLVYWDMEDYNALVAVGPEFGCVHHVEKETA